MILSSMTDKEIVQMLLCIISDLQALDDRVREDIERVKGALIIVEERVDGCV